MGDLEIQVQRTRQHCPFCHDPIVGGLVWLCPDCQAQHHGPCAEELGRCGACQGGPPPPELRVAPAETFDPRQATPEEQTVSDGVFAADDPRLVEDEVGVELEALGFAWDPKTRRGIHPAWRYGPMLRATELAVVVQRCEEELSWARIEADARRLTQGDLAVVGLYFAPQLDGEARLKLAHGTLPWPFFPVIRVAALQEALYASAPSTLWPAQVLRLPGLRFLARRLLSPRVARDHVREQLAPSEWARLSTPPLALGLVAALAWVGLSGQAPTYALPVAIALAVLGAGVQRQYLRARLAQGR